MRRAAAILALAGLAAASAARAAGPSGPAAPVQQVRPNIVFILTDDLGVNDLGAYGRREHRTPNLDRLAAEGLRFTTAYVASPICSPSRAAMMTGLAPARLHITTFLPGRADAVTQRLLHPKIRPHLPLDQVTLAERLQAAGYATGAIGKWHLGGAGFGPLEQGFDSYHAGRANTTPSDSEGGKGEYDLTRHAEAFIDANRGRPFFLFLSHNNPHIPYTATPARIDASAGAFEPVYAAVIETLDDSVGRLLARIEAAGLRDRTIVIFTSDNGGLHVPELRHERVTHNTPFRAGKGFMYEGGLRVPLIARGPGLAAKQVVEVPVVNTDWVPTLLDLAGLPVPDGLDGISQARLLATGSSPEAARRPLFWHLPHYTNQGSRPSGAIRDGDWKLVEHYDTGQVELFNLRQDAGESTNLASAEPARASSLRERLRTWRLSVGAQENSPNPDADAARFKELYEDFDASRFDPLQADAAAWQAVKEWRQRMDEAVKK